ncbi:MAG: hypothetical protein K6F31_03950 [Acetatifactor sp.]|nr:hypothetical protein [Acetatifactor sp.]
MKKVEISINLDPVNDGVKVTEEERKPAKDAHGLVIATNGDYEEVGSQEVAHILKGLSETFDVDCMGNTPFVAVFNKKKVLRNEGHKYLAGSVLIVKEGEESIELLSSEELEQAKLAFISRLVALKMGDASFSAYEIG